MQRCLVALEENFKGYAISLLHLPKQLLVSLMTFGQALHTPSPLETPRHRLAFTFGEGISWFASREGELGLIPHPMGAIMQALHQG